MGPSEEVVGVCRTIERCGWSFLGISYTAVGPLEEMKGPSFNVVGERRLGEHCRAIIGSCWTTRGSGGIIIKSCRTVRESCREIVGPSEEVDGLSKEVEEPSKEVLGPSDDGELEEIVEPLEEINKL